MLRIDVLLYGDKAYITEIETESGIGPILCEGMICDERLKKTSKQHLKFFEGIRDGILQIILQSYYSLRILFSHHLHKSSAVAYFILCNAEH